MDASDKGNPVPIILGFTFGVVLLFMVGNVYLWYMAQKNAPKSKAKKVGAKAAKRENLRRGLMPAGE